MEDQDNFIVLDHLLTKEELPDPTPFGFTQDDIEIFHDRNLIRINKPLSTKQDYDNWFNKYLKLVIQKVEQKCNPSKSN